MPEVEATELYAKGLEALENGHYYLARTCFGRAYELEQSPRTSSYFGLALAKSTGGFPEAIALARDATAKDPDNPVYYLNLGQIYLLADQRREALLMFRLGLQHGADSSIVRELEELGERKPPIFRNLPRSHPLNRYLGLLLSRLGVR
ncbi:tetratricopeptide repeat protein [Geomobilimonas luticola]|uniref:Tetratricopeptide repeat protein n=1 Tax=Geomobilimonas luticola TaxID=1114878 RepID=A0ABS5SCU5_9BACT|nr:tetratricopeptide repeat protein [Geomobilimonas luticola]MBT0653193.1 hypothetical protein [Geomobilimonas luticola]